MLFPTKRASWGAQSVITVSSSIATDDGRPEDYSDDDLVSLVESLTLQNKHMALENEFMERYLVRMDPAMSPVLQQLLEQAASAAAAHSRIQAATSNIGQPEMAMLSLERQFETSTSPHSSRMSPSVVKFGTTFDKDRGPRINVNYKMDMLAREIDEVQKELEKLQNYSERCRDNLHAQLQQFHLVLEETKESGERLEKEVVQEIDPMTGRVPAEKFVRFMEEWFKASDSMIEKLRLGTSTLRSQKLRVVQQLKQKEELGEMLHAVDFDQMRIQNKDAMERIEKKNLYLLELKKVTGTCALQLTNSKNHLMEQLNKLSELKSSVEEKQQQYKDIQEEGNLVEEEVQQANQQYEAIKNLMAKYTVPDVMDYVRKKAELHELHKAVKVWSRRKKIQQTALNSCAAILKNLPANASRTTIDRYRSTAISGDILGQFRSIGTGMY